MTDVAARRLACQVQHIVAIAAAISGVPERQVVSAGPGTNREAEVRHQAIFAASVLLDVKTSRLAQLFNRRSGAVTYAVRQIKGRMPVDPALRAEVARLLAAAIPTVYHAC